MISAGDLDRKVVIERATDESSDNWDTYVTCRAMRRDVSDGERNAGGHQVDSFLMSRFTVRSSTETRGITPVDRLIHEGHTWSIKGVKEANEGRFRFIEITAVKDAD